MSGSSLDGLDIAYTTITDVRNDWSFELQHCSCLPLPAALKEQLAKAATLSVPEFLKLHTAFGRWMGEQVNAFIAEHDLQHKVHFISSHGHTVFHEPQSGTSTQIGDGASIAAVCKLPVITDLRNMDVALGGQGAPIVPIADKLFFKDYLYCLNIGGICNITINTEAPIAFDIAPANQVLNHYARSLGMDYDRDGALASSGKALPELIQALHALPYCHQPAPKSLANEFTDTVLQIIDGFAISTQDKLASYCQFLAEQVGKQCALFGVHPGAQMLITGGGALHQHLIACIQEAMATQGINVVVPDPQVIAYKEALAMALIGVLRWREEANVLSSVTGASGDSIGGALWLGN